MEKRFFFFLVFQKHFLTVKITCLPAFWNLCSHSLFGKRFRDRNRGPGIVRQRRWKYQNKSWMWSPLRVIRPWFCHLNNLQDHPLEVGGESTTVREVLEVGGGAGQKDSRHMLEAINCQFDSAFASVVTGISSPKARVRRLLIQYQ